MDQKSKGKENKPLNAKEFNEELLQLGNNKMCERGTHTFVMRTSREAVCSACKTGYILTPGMMVTNGRILNEGMIVI